jgi:hypothetical protein
MSGVQSGPGILDAFRMRREVWPVRIAVHVEVHVGAHVLCVLVGILPAPSVRVRGFPARPHIGSDAQNTPDFVNERHAMQSMARRNLKRKIGRPLRSGLLKGKPAAPYGAAG